jgi:pentatricopeptide repeat-containing protein PET309
MPMLERTAATLEPCSLHKVLPSVPRSARSRRQLHTAFWNHGAASVELFDACQALLGVDMDEVPPANTAAVAPAVPTKGAELMTASAFLLDFLYPRGTLSLLRKLNCNPLERYEGPSFRLGSSIARFQGAGMSSTVHRGAAAQAKPAVDVDMALAQDMDTGEAQSNNTAATDARQPGRESAGAGLDSAPKSFEDLFAAKIGVDPLDDPQTKGKRKKGKRSSIGVTADDAPDSFEAAFTAKARPIPTKDNRPVSDNVLEDVWAIATPAKKVYRSLTEIFESRHLREEEFADPDKLKKALSVGSSTFPDHVWRLYEQLDPALRDQHTIAVLKYLAVAPSIPEPRAFCDMVSTLDPFLWTQELVKAAIETSLSTLDDLPAATEFFNRALEVRGWPQGFDLLLAHDLTKAHWNELLMLWDTSRERLLSDDVPNVGLYSTIKIYKLSAVLSDFWEHVRTTSHKDTYKLSRDRYDSLLRYILTESLEFLAMDDAAFIVKHLADPGPYEELIKLCVRRKEHKLATELYKSYRKLPKVKIRIPVLREMLDVFYPNSGYGMEMILKDWYSRYDKLDYIAYRKFICFYAGQGDIASVVRLWKEYKRLYKSKAVADRRAVRALIDVYAVRGDVANARAIFDEVTVGQGRRPDTMQYNMLLAAHDKAGDLDGALETFKELCDNATPNNYSFGYLMNITGSRGNLSLTLGLYRMARAQGIAADVAMVDAMVEAYCQSDRMESAENLCGIVTKRRLLPEEITYSGRVTTPYTIIWNTVLRHYAVRHDLTNVNRVLEHMSELKIQYDGKTYEYLLLALVLCKQANHALKLVELAEEKGIFTPTAEHYLLLMSSYLATREPAAVMKINRLMTDKEYPESTEKMTKLMQAFGQWTQLPRGARLGTSAHVYLEAALHTFRTSLGRGNRTARDDIRSIADQYSKMIDILTQMREFANIPEIMALYGSQFPEHSAPRHMPLKLLTSLMRADFYENKFDAVMEAWEAAFNKVSALKQHAPLPDIPEAEQENDKVAPAHRFLLNEPLSVVFKVHAATGDIESLVAIVTRVLDAGFALSGQNWNHYVQLLARFGRWQEAFTLCERVLMPQWPGWAQRRRRLRQKVRLPLDLRRLGGSYRHARPNTHTLLLLTKKFMELEQIAPWSSEPAALVDRINAECPRFVRAAKTMVPTGSDLENEILGRLDGREGKEDGDGDEEVLKYIMPDEDFGSEGEAAAEYSR